MNELARVCVYVLNVMFQKTYLLDANFVELSSLKRVARWLGDSKYRGKI